MSAEGFEFCVNICSRKFPPGYFAPANAGKLAPQTYDRSLSFPPPGFPGPSCFGRSLDRIGR